MLETSAGTAGRRAGALLAVCAASIGLLAGPAALSAWADDTATTFAVQASVARTGTLQVKETVTFTGPGPARLSQRFEIRENSTGDRQYVQRVSGVTATARGKALPVTTKNDDPYTTVTVDTGGAGAVQLSYTVTGTVITTQGGGTALRWGLLQGLSVPVDRFSATVQVPSSISYVACTAGSPNSTTPCGSASGGTEGTQNPTFTDGPRGQGEVVAVDIGFPAGAVTADERIEHRWTVGRAFSADPLPLALALGLLLLGGLALWALHRRNGRDLAATGPITRAGEFVPTGAGESEFRVVGEVRPGHVGTVVDERVDPIDVTASLVDLAVRGHLLITELPRPTAYAPTDWTLTRQGGATDDALNPFETRLLDAIAPVGSSLKVS